MNGSLPSGPNTHAVEEYDSKNMSREGGGVQAIGIDVSKYLPGIYWLNFFGKPYRVLIGQERLLTCPAQSVQQLDDGVLVSLSTDPTEWDSSEYRDRERRVIEHLGNQYFFDRNNREQSTVAPPFVFPKARND